MNPLDHKKNWMAFLSQLKEEKPLQPEQFKHLAKVFEDILVKNVDPEEALGLAYGRVNKESDAHARQLISAILPCVACYIEDDPIHSTPPLTLAEAFIRVADEFPRCPYSAEQIEKYWYQKDKVHMQETKRNHFDKDSSY